MSEQRDNVTPTTEFNLPHLINDYRSDILSGKNLKMLVFLLYFTFHVLQETHHKHFAVRGGRSFYKQFPANATQSPLWIFLENCIN